MPYSDRCPTPWGGAEWSRGTQIMRFLLACFVVFALALATATSLAAPPALTLSRTDNWLIIHGPRLPGGVIRINYLEAYCRAQSTDADWVKHTVIPHHTELLSLDDDHKVLRLKCTLADGVTVQHTITAHDDEVDFRLTAHNPGSKRSEAHWRKPVRDWAPSQATTRHRRIWTIICQNVSSFSMGSSRDCRLGSGRLRHAIHRGRFGARETCLVPTSTRVL